MAWKYKGLPVSLKANSPDIMKIVTMEGCPGDRPMTDNRVGTLKTAMQKGEFTTAQLATVYCIATEKTYRINGKHTVTAISQLDGECPTIQLTLQRFEADTLEDVAALYATFDPRSSTRTTSDINHSYACTDDDLKNISLRNINLAVSAMSFHYWKTSIRLASERAGLLLNHKPFVLWLNGMIVGYDGYDRVNSRLLQKAPVAAAMFGTWLKASQKATEFFSSVRDQSDPSAASQSRILAKQLLITSSSNRRRTKNKSFLPSVTLYSYCLKAWNYWREKRPLLVLKMAANEKIPEIV